MKKQTEKGKITALYERLSHDDGRSDESVSVENQKRILEDYAHRNGFTNIRHFTDDGVRGTAFKRPGLDVMPEEIRAAGDPEAQARYERFLATKRENYHRKKQAEIEAEQAS